MIVSSQTMSTSLPMPDSLTVGISNVMFSQSIKTLGMTLDTHLSMKIRVVNLAKTADFELRRITSIRYYLSLEATQPLVSAFVTSRLDYCHSHLYGCPQNLINILQKVQNNAVHLQTLHLLPVDARIQYKICSLCFSAINSSGPQYFADLLKIYTPSRQLCSSADTCTLSIPSIHTQTYGQRAFHTLHTLSRISL